MNNKPQKPQTDIEQALVIVAEIDDLAERVPEAAEEFAQSVQERAEAIAENIEARGRVTPAQLSALENMRDGLQAWIHD